MDELAEITRHLLRSSPDALVVIDDGGEIRFANDAVAELLGYRPADLVGRPLEVLIPERLRPRHGEHIASFFRDPRNREMGAAIADLCARRIDGTEFPAAIRLAPFKVGDRFMVAAAIRDITERQRINEALVVAREEAVRANRAKSRFLATASHDLRQPLQTVKLLNAAMMRMAREKEIGELLKHQEQAIESAARLLNALLDISRLESGAIEAHPTHVSLPSLLDELRAEFDSVAQDRGLRLDVEAARVIVFTDRILLHQLLQNLFSNAIKYTDRGSVSVSCSQSPQMLLIHVRDTGIGIPRDKLERIFDEYYQVDTHGAKRMGVGLGLAIVKEVARLLEFKIRIDSSESGSTEATIEIPASFLRAAPCAVEVSALPAAAPRTAQTRILLVEDNDGVRMATELFLKLEGFAIRSAASFEEAQRMLGSLEAGEVLVADYHLATSHTGLDVLELARRVSGMVVPGIILSGDLPSVIRSNSSSFPAVRFLAKPVDTRALLEAIGDLSGHGAAGMAAVP